MLTIIYGITASTDTFLSSEYNTGSNIYACTKGGEELNGNTAISLEELSKIDARSISRVVICSELLNEIIPSLSAINIPIEKCFFYCYHSNSLKSCKELAIQGIEPDDTLFAFYDLKYCLPCYDVTTFVVLAEQERLNKKKKHIKFIIVPHSDEEGYSPFHSANDMRFRIENIVKPMFSSLKSYIATDELISRRGLDKYKEFHQFTYPDGYYDGHPHNSNEFELLKTYKKNGTDISAIEPHEQYLNLTREFLANSAKGKKVITVTLREYAVNADTRNSNLREWAKFIAHLDKEVYFPVIIRDTYNCTAPLPHYFENVATFPLASVSLHYRLAIYKLAHVNMGINNGPIYPISYIKDSRSIIFYKVLNEVPTLSESSYKKYGFVIGKNHFFNDNDLQITFWGEDSFENLKAAFEAFNKKIASPEKQTGENFE